MIRTGMTLAVALWITNPVCRAGERRHSDRTRAARSSLEAVQAVVRLAEARPTSAQQTRTTQTPTTLPAIMRLVHQFDPRQPTVRNHSRANARDRFNGHNQFAFPPQRRFSARRFHRRTRHGFGFFRPWFHPIRFFPLFGQPVIVSHTVIVSPFFPVFPTPFFNAAAIVLHAPPPRTILHTSVPFPFRLGDLGRIHMEAQRQRINLQVGAMQQAASHPQGTTLGGLGQQSMATEAR